MKTCVIIAAMGLSDKEAADIRSLEEHYIICADAGYKHAKAQNIVPDIIIGDFDSYEGAVEEIEGNIETFPIRKDDTDTMLAIKHGLRNGMRNFMIYGALGGRLDHTMANIVSLRYLLDNGAKGWLISPENCVTMIENDSITVKKDDDYPNFSLFCYGKKASGISIKGCEYSFDEIELDENFPLGVSNHIIEDSAHVAVRDGALIVILAA